MRNYAKSDSPDADGHRREGLWHGDEFLALSKYIKCVTGQEQMMKTKREFWIAVYSRDTITQQQLSP